MTDTPPIVERPRRVQLSRRKGWRMPENTVRVARPGLFGNPFVVNPRFTPGSRSGAEYISVPTVEDAVECYRLMLEQPAEPGERAYEIRQRLPELRGKNLACFCRLDAPCHADVLLRLANAPLPASLGEA